MNYNATSIFFFFFFRFLYLLKKCFCFVFLSTTQSGTRPQKSSCLWQEVQALALSVTFGPSRSVS